MGFNMQTIATFSNGIAANLAKGRLEETGIRVYLADEQTVGLAWHLTNAIGGIKLQVADEDVDEARAVLAEQGDDEPVTGPPAIEENSVVDDADASDEPEITSTLREQTADRALRGALFGLLLFPLEFYVVWLLVKVFVSDEKLDRRRWRNAVVAAVISLPCVLFILFYFQSVLRLV
jgi:hypothetical protein